MRWDDDDDAGLDWIGSGEGGVGYVRRMMMMILVVMTMMIEKAAAHCTALALVGRVRGS